MFIFAKISVRVLALTRFSYRAKTRTQTEYDHPTIPLKIHQKSIEAFKFYVMLNF